MSDSIMSGGKSRVRKPNGRPGFSRFNVNKAQSKNNSPDTRVKFNIQLSPERQKEIKEMIKNRIDSVVTKST